MENINSLTHPRLHDSSVNNNLIDTKTFLYLQLCSSPFWAVGLRQTCAWFYEWQERRQKAALLWEHPYARIHPRSLNLSYMGTWMETINTKMAESNRWMDTEGAEYQKPPVISNDSKFLGTTRHHFLLGQASPAPFDAVEVRIHFISSINGDINLYKEFFPK